jgi:hypothetical protein
MRVGESPSPDYGDVGANDVTDPPESAPVSQTGAAQAASLAGGEESGAMTLRIAAAAGATAASVSSRPRNERGIYIIPAKSVGSPMP